MNYQSFSSPDPRRNFYLDNARMYVQQSRLDPKRESELLEKAELLVAKAKSLEVKDEVQELKKQFSDFVLAKKPTRSFKDVGGLEKVKDSIKLKIVEPLKRPEIFKYFGKKMGGGILMYGPPGCGKSLIAEATAGECNATFFNIKASDLKSKYVGETERNIAKLFKEARQHQPSIIFFDEFESIGAERTSSNPYDRSMVSQLLAETDGVGNKDQQILLIAATNEPWSVDLALRREGRFGTGIFVPPPDLKAREEILKILLKDKPVEENVDVQLLAQATEGYSGADLEEMCNGATESAIKDCLTKNKLRQISVSDFKEVLKRKAPSSPLWLKKAWGWVDRNREHDFFKELVDFREGIAISS